MSTSTSEILFKITRKDVSSPSSASMSNRNENSNMEVDDETEDNSNTVIGPDIILSILWKGNNLGAAYYKINNRQLYFMKDMMDLPPDYRIMKLLIQQTNPLHVITIGSRTDKFITGLVNVLLNKDKDEDQSVESDQYLTLPQNVTLLPSKFNALDISVAKVMALNLASEPKDLSDKEKQIFLLSLVDVESKLSMHALGILIKFIEKNWSSFCRNHDNNCPLQFMDINKISLNNTVFIDKNTFNALQIFKVKTHDASFKHGAANSYKEGLGIYKIFSSSCKSKVGQMYMRYILVNPTNNIVELNNRFDFIRFALEPKHQGFIDNIRDEMKFITDLNKVLVKIMYTQAKTKDWNIFVKTLMHIISINEMCRKYKEKFAIFEEINSVVTAELYGLLETVNKSLDLTQTDKRQRAHIKYGLDNELDKKKLKQKDIVKTVTAAASFAISQLPEFLQECSIVYVPEVGHLISIKEWDPRCNRHQLNAYGYQFVFELRGNLFYKNNLCKELDIRFEEIQGEILNHETRIIQRLSAYVIQYSKNIRESIRIIAVIDCIIAMAIVAKNGNFIRPIINNDNFHEIDSGRHPIFEMHLPSFVPNHFISGSTNDMSRVKILTGPNSSGKSVFLKQTALLIYLAHIGSYLPAKRANIGLVDSIYSRISAIETASVPLSAFMIDLIQMSQAMRNCTKRSLILIDEFGKGTSGNVGQALLAGAIYTFVNDRNKCPHVIVSTHFQTLVQDLPKTPLIRYLKMDHIMDNNKLVFLYRLSEGISKSYAFDVARIAGLESEIVDRAEQFLEAMQTNKPVKPLPSNFPPAYAEIVGNQDFETVFKFLDEVKVPKFDVEENEKKNQNKK